MGNSFILFGILLIVIGIIMNVILKFGLPILPGDILLKRENFTFYFPIVSSLLLSIILTIIINLFKK